MKKFKKIMAVLVAAIMVVAMTVPAWAIDITINKDSDNIDPSAITYTWYKIFDASYSSNTTTDSTISANPQAETKGFSYTIPANSPLLTVTNGVAAIDGVSNINFVLSADGTKYIVTNTTSPFSEATAKTMADAIKAKIATLSAEQKATLGTGTLTWNAGDSAYKASGLDPAYYLIESNYNAKLVLATSDIRITEKNSYPTIAKAFVNATDDSVQIGDVIPYTVSVVIPDGSNQQIVITDTYEPGLTPQVAATTGTYKVDNTKTPSTEGQVYVTATVDTVPNLNFAVSTPNTPNNGKFTITLTAAQVTALAGKTIVFTYYAQLNANAEVRATGDLSNTNDNTVDLKYGTDYDATPSSVSTTTQTITLTKYDSTDDATKTPIAGAIFQLKKADVVVNLVKVSDTEYRVATPEEVTAAAVTAFTDETTAMENGKVTSNVRTVAGTDKAIVVKGLDDDVSYTWVEVKAPTGYNPTTSNSNVTPAKDNVVNTDIANVKGTVLPSTGGMGTTVLYIVGGMLVILAGAYLFFSRKRTA